MQLSDAFQNALEGLYLNNGPARVEPARTLRELRDRLGSNQVTARALVAFGGSKSYDSALRTVERYMQGTRGRAPQKKTMVALARMANAEAQRENERREAAFAAHLDELRGRVMAQLRRGGVRVHFEGWITVSPGGRKPDERYREFTERLSGEEMGQVLDELEAAGTEAAAELFGELLMRAYGIHGAVEYGDIDVLDWRL